MSVYLDNPATTWPKPKTVIEAVNRSFALWGANPGRAGHDGAIASGELVYQARERVASFFDVENPMGVCFMKNITEAINTALYGLLKPGDHAICSAMEHNAVIRPLRNLQEQGVELSIVPCDTQGLLDPQDVKKAIKKNTRLVCMIHGSNVNGSVQDISSIGKICRAGGILLMVDSAQTAGILPISMEHSSIDILAFTGHKTLLGPMGIGGLILGSRVKGRDLKPLIHGGTGSRSEEEYQPDFFPDSLESGTPNIPGIAGLVAGIDWVEREGLWNIYERKRILMDYLIQGLRDIENLTCYLSQQENRLPLVSLNMKGYTSSELAGYLNDQFAIYTRAGLHCAPLAHKTLGTFPQGSLRIGPGYETSFKDLGLLVTALGKLSEGRQ